MLVFGKILKNEIDEEFRFIQKKLRDTIVEILKTRVAKRFFNDSLEEIEEKVKRKIKGMIKRQECVEILKFLYNDQDFFELFSLMNGFFKENRIDFKVFEQIVLGFQQKMRERMLQDLVSKFKSVDDDHDGVISLKQFEELLGLLSIQQSYKEIFDGILQLTLSDCVVVLSREIISKH